MAPSSTLAESPTIPKNIFCEEPEIQANTKVLDSVTSEFILGTIHNNLPISLQAA